MDGGAAHGRTTWLGLAESRLLAERYAAEFPQRARLNGDRLEFGRITRGQILLLFGFWVTCVSVMVLVALDSVASAGSVREPQVVIGVLVVAALLVFVVAGYDYLELDTGTIFRRSRWGFKRRINVRDIDQITLSPHRYFVGLRATGTLDGRRVAKEIGVFRTHAEAEGFRQLVMAMRNGQMAG